MLKKQATQAMRNGSEAGRSQVMGCAGAPRQLRYALYFSLWYTTPTARRLERVVRAAETERKKTVRW